MLLKQCLAFTPLQPDSNFGRFSLFLGLKNIDVKNFGVKLQHLIILIFGCERPRFRAAERRETPWIWPVSTRHPKGLQGFISSVNQRIGHRRK